MKQDRRWMKRLPAFLFAPFSRSMNCFIMIKDKTGVNDTFTFSLQRGGLDSIWMKAGAAFCLCAAAVGKGTYMLMRSVGLGGASWENSPRASRLQPGPSGFLSQVFFFFFPPQAMNELKYDLMFEVPLLPHSGIKRRLKWFRLFCVFFCTFFSCIFGKAQKQGGCIFALFSVEVVPNLAVGLS